MIVWDWNKPITNPNGVFSGITLHNIIAQVLLLSTVEPSSTKQTDNPSPATSSTVYVLNSFSNMYFTERIKIRKKWTTVPHTTTTNPALTNTHLFLCQDQVVKQCKLNTTGLIPRMNHNQLFLQWLRLGMKMRKWRDLVWYAYTHVRREVTFIWGLLHNV
jgi:hypothetical protein